MSRDIMVIWVLTLLAAGGDATTRLSYAILDELIINRTHIVDNKWPIYKVEKLIWSSYIWKPPFLSGVDLKMSGVGF
jgi:hypothetical protein